MSATIAKQASNNRLHIFNIIDLQPYLLRRGSAAVPRERIAKHLSERGRLSEKSNNPLRRCEFSDNLAGDKRLIVLNISALQQTIAARSYEKTYNLAGIPMSYIYRNHLIINALRLFNITKSSARLSDT